MSLMTLSESGIRSRRVPKWKQLLTELRQRGRRLRAKDARRARSVGSGTD